MEKVERLLAELEERDEARELVREYGTIETASDYAEATLSAAEKLGIETDVDVSELVGYLEAAEASQRDATERAACDVLELEDDDLENVAGGFECKGQPLNCENQEARVICGNLAVEKIPDLLQCVKNDKCATWWWN